MVSSSLRRLLSIAGTAVTRSVATRATIWFGCVLVNGGANCVCALAASTDFLTLATVSFARAPAASGRAHRPATNAAGERSSARRGASSRRSRHDGSQQPSEPRCCSAAGRAGRGQRRAAIFAEADLAAGRSSAKTRSTACSAAASCASRPASSRWSASRRELRGARTPQVVLDRSSAADHEPAQPDLRNVELPLEGMTSQRLGDYLDSLPVPAMIAVFRAVEWEDYGLLTFSSQLIYSIIEVLWAGAASSMPGGSMAARSPDRARPDRAAGRVCCTTWTPRSPSSARSSSASSASRPIRATPRSAADQWRTCVQDRAEMDDRGGRFESCCPTPRSSRCAICCCRRFGGEKLGSNTLWAAASAAADADEHVELEAVLEEQSVPLAR